ncbi:MAG: AAA family ATPase [Candidatus Hydrogenedentes bacterium]|nr:AAA family ATPase [Candidatus Hydrogenedentota bacterium]
MHLQDTFEASAAAFIADFARVREEIGRVIVGQDALVQDVLTALCAGGHVLLEGVPGIGKTMLVHTLADVVDSQFSRIQFTPDLMPSDIVGTRVVHEDERGARHFSFQRGPVFTQVLLADEINRATPKTQSALLEAMQERAVTVAGETHKLDRPFFVIATQNPLEMEGTYPLPEAQLDRFLFKLQVGYPTVDELVEVGRRTTGNAVPRASRAITAARLCEHMETVRAVPVADPVEYFAAEILVRSHPDHAGAPDLVRRYVKYGASPRGLQAMLLGAKVRALLDGRYHVSESDIESVCLQSLRHRLIQNFEGEAEAIAPDAIVRAIVSSVNAHFTVRP